MRRLAATIAARSAPGAEGEEGVATMAGAAPVAEAPETGAMGGGRGQVPPRGGDHSMGGRARHCFVTSAVICSSHRGWGIIST